MHWAVEQATNDLNLTLLTLFTYGTVDEFR